MVCLSNSKLDRMRKNYRLLKEAGYSTEVASRYKNASDSTIALILKQRPAAIKIPSIISRNREKIYKENEEILIKAGVPPATARIRARTTNVKRIKRIAAAYKRKRTLERKKKKREEFRKKYHYARHEIHLGSKEAKRVASHSWSKLLARKNRHLIYIERLFMKAYNCKEADIRPGGRYYGKFQDVLKGLEYRGRDRNKPDSPLAMALVELGLREATDWWMVGDTDKFEKVVTQYG